MTRAARTLRRSRARDARDAEGRPAVDLVYGAAHPSSYSTASLDKYSIPAGQTYVAKDLVGADDYSASTSTTWGSYSVQRSSEQFDEIFFNHRIADVRRATSTWRAERRPKAEPALSRP